VNNNKALIMEDAWDDISTGTDSKQLLLSPQKLFLFDFFLLSISFYISHYFKQGSFMIPPGYIKLLFLFYVCWFIASVIGKKFNPNLYRHYRDAIGVLFKSDIYLSYCITFTVVIFNLSVYSRFQVFATCLVLLVMDIMMWSVVYWLVYGRFGAALDRAKVTQDIDCGKSRMSYRLLGADLALLIASFFMVNIIKRGQIELLPGYEKLLLILIGLWFLIAISTNKFSIQDQKKFYFSFWQWVKAALLMMAVMAIVMFGLRLFHYSRFQGFGTICLFMGLEVLLLVFYFAGRKQKAQKPDIESVDQVKDILGQAKFDLNLDMKAIRQKLLAPARHKIEARLKAIAPELFDFIDEHVELDDILCLEAAVGNGYEPFALHTDMHLVRLFLNLHKLNDVRRLNQYLLQIHHVLLPGGYFIGFAHTIQTHHQWIYTKFPRQIASIVYAFDFCVRRIMPKLPGLQKIYFALTNGKNRIISRAELLGRLCFCGFEIKAEKVINQRLCVIARKVKTASLETSPTYGPLVTLTRSGYRDAEIKVYKLRTMHPYSEYLQKYVFELQGLQKGGKLNNDFRVTTWGKVMRKLWLDELPMLYNWLKGDLKIVGVRPLSSHYLSLYDDELKEMRRNTKPGLLPPFYVDLPDTFYEILESERKYLQSYYKSPIKTDLTYFFRCFCNIVIKKARSK